MTENTYRTMIFAVGALPFWTGKNKLIRLLRGEAGSYWKGETPLKRIYLNQPFFGELTELSSSEVRRRLQELLNARYLVREPVSRDKPYPVVKFSDKGAKKYYNQLVRERGFDEPYWWIHHVSRLREQPNSPISTGGELLEYNQTLYLTQTPAYRTQTERVQSEQTLPIEGSGSTKSENGHYKFHGLEISFRKGPILTRSDKTTLERVNPSDLGRKLNHFNSEQSQVEPPDPYVIRGELVDPGEPDADGTRNLTLRNSEGDRLIVTVKTNQVPDELPLRKGQKIVLGPVTESEDATGTRTNETWLTLEQSGELRPVSP